MYPLQNLLTILVRDFFFLIKKYIYGRVSSKEEVFKMKIDKILPKINYVTRKSKRVIHIIN